MSNLNFSSCNNNDRNVSREMYIMILIEYRRDTMQKRQHSESQSQCLYGLTFDIVHLCMERLVWCSCSENLNTLPYRGIDIDSVFRVEFSHRTAFLYRKRGDDNCRDG
jgi:hypothetical protein